MLVHIDSSKRVAGTMDNFRINIDQPLDLPDNVNLSISNLVIPQTWYNVREDTVFHFNNGTPQSSTIPAGDYTSTEFKTTFETEVGFTIDFNDITHKVTISDPSAYNFSIQWSQQPKLAYLLGFDPIDSASSDSHEGQNAFNMSPDLTIYLDLGAHTCYNGSDINCTFIIPIYGNGGSFSTGAGLGTVTVPSDLFKRQLNVKLLDTDSNNFPIRSDWTVTFQLN